MQSRTPTTPVTCATDVARSDRSWGLTPKTGPKRSAVERNLPHLCVPLCGRVSAAWARRLVVEVNTSDNLYSNDRRSREVDHKTKGRPPASVGDKLTAVLPEVLDTVPSKADDQQPRCACDRRGGNDDEDAGNAAFDG